MHTPAPWRQVTQFDEQQEPHHYVDTVGGDTVASCFTEDDARLIAAAPELLEALELLVDYMENPFEKMHTKSPRLRYAQEMIAKAKGER